MKRRRETGALTIFMSALLVSAALSGRTHSAPAATATGPPDAVMPAGTCAWLPFLVSTPERPQPSPRVPVTGASFDAYGASLSTPATATFRGGPVLLLDRQAPGSPTRVVVSVENEGVWLTLCDTGLLRPIDHLIEPLQVTSPAPGEQRWRVAVFKTNSDLDALPPPRITLGGASSQPAQITFEPPHRPVLGIPLGQTPGPPVGCKLVDRAIPPQWRLEASGREKSIDDSFEFPQSIRFVARHRAYVKVSAPAQARLRVTLLTSAGGPDIPACEVQASGAQLANRYVAADPAWEDTFERMWRVRVEQVGGKRPLLVHLAPAHEVDPKAERVDVADSPGQEGDICAVHTAYVRFRKPAAPGVRFAAAASVRVHLVEDGVTLSPAFRLGIRTAVLGALNTWRRACQQCRDEELSVAEIDGALFSLPGLIGADGHVANFPPPGRGQPYVRPDWGKFGGRGTGVGVYEPLDLSAVQRSRLCALGFRQGDILDLSGTLLCAEVGPNVLNVNIVIRANGAHCDASANVVGCWNGLGLIELNARDYKYYQEGPFAPLFGGGPTLVDLTRVIEHEVGHWHGLGHFDNGHSIMNPRFLTADCIDDDTVARVNAIAIGEAPAQAGGAERLTFK